MNPVCQVSQVSQVSPSSPSSARPARATRSPVPWQCHGPSRATCHVGGGSAAVKRPALPSRHHRPPPCKRHNHVDVLQASGLHPRTVNKATSVAIALPRATRSPCRGNATALARDLSRGPPHCRQRITGRHLVKGTTTSMYCKPLACTPRTVKKATSVAIAVSAIYPQVVEWFSHIKNLKFLIKKHVFLLIKVYF